MKNRSAAYRHFIPEVDLAIERYTSNVPDDGRYHIVKAGKVTHSFRSLKQAEEKFRQLLLEIGLKPKSPPTESVNASDESIDRYVLEKEIFWAEGPKYRNKHGKGGRGGRGGV